MARPPLTQQHRREAKGAPSFPNVEGPKIGRLCPGCGKKLRRRDRRLCVECSVPITRKNFDEGRRRAQQPELLAKRSATQKDTQAGDPELESVGPAQLADA